MGTLTKGYTFGATEEVTAAKLHLLIDSGTVTGIVGADINDGVITDAKITGLSGSKLTGLASIPAGAGTIPSANLGTAFAAKGANSDITSLSGLTTALSVAQGGTGQTTSPLTTAKGGTGATANANAASGVVVLDANSKLPAVDGSQLTGITTTGYFTGTFTRDSEGIAGDVSYTGTGFTPKMIQLTTLFTPGRSEGFDTVTNRWCRWYRSSIGNSGYNTTTTYSIYCVDDGDDGQAAIVKSLDSNGFTLTWTPISGGTHGTITVLYVAFK